MGFIRQIEEYNVHRFTHEAMATIFEALIADRYDKSYAEQAAHSAFEILDAVENELSCFLPGSDVSRVNAAASGKEISVGQYAFEAIKLSEEYRALTSGYFDIRIGAGIHKLKSGDKSVKVGGRLNIVQNEENYSVSKADSSTELDLGGMGKGYALDKMAEHLEEWDIADYFLHGGGSSSRAAGSPREGKKWTVSISDPVRSGRVYTEIELDGLSLSASGIAKGNHIFDPKTGLPAASGRPAAWALAPSAALSDALSTAFMLMPEEKIRLLCSRNKNLKAILYQSDEFIVFGHV